VGHQIPAWYCACGETVVAEETPSTCPACGSGELRQDEDVLDTWFSSALWPFATLGWPEETADLSYFYPTAVLSTARDILYLWVARMIMMGLRFMDEVPYDTVLIHQTVLNFEGRRMSKSLGTGVDPLDLMEKYGPTGCASGSCSRPRKRRTCASPRRSWKRLGTSATRSGMRRGLCSERWTRRGAPLARSCRPRRPTARRSSKATRASWRRVALPTAGCCRGWQASSGT